MTPKWQQSEKAEVASRFLSEGRIMSVQGPELFFPEIWQNHGQMNLNTFLLIDGSLMLTGLPLLMIL